MSSTQKGHRDRLRQKLDERGLDGFSDQEIFEYFLFAINARRDTKPIVKACFARFKTLEGILKAPPDKLKQVTGLGDETIRYLNLIVALLDRLSFQRLESVNVISNWKDLEYYCIQKLAFQPIEKFMMITLDNQNQVTKVKDFGEGTINQMTVYPREVLKVALAADAVSVILVHNHPSKDKRASRQDIAMTKSLQTILQSANIKLLDHVIIAGGTCVSLKAQGLF